jgi:hypothetical protein
MLPKARKLIGIAAHRAVPSHEAARVTTICDCFIERAESALRHPSAMLRSAQSPTAQSRIHTQYQAAITILHLVLDNELDAL